MSDWGQGVVNNTIEWGRGSTNNTIDWGSVYADSPSGDTALKTSGFANVYSTEYDGVDDYVDFGSSSTLNDGGQFSFSFWIKAPSTGSNFHRDYLFSGDPSSNLNRNWNIDTNDFVWNNINNNKKVLSAGVLDDAWHHILVIFNPSGADQTIRCFTDGANEVNVTTDYRYKQVGGLYTGKLRYFGNNPNDANGRQMVGKLDEVAFWNDDQSANVSNIYNSGVVHNLNDLTSPPLSYIRFEEGSGTTATDSGTGGNNGTLINGTAYSTDVPT